MKSSSAILSGFVLAAAAGGIVGAQLVPPAFSQQAASQPGRFVKLGITPASPAWRANHSADTNIIWSMDSTSGAILGCGDATGACSSIPGSAPRR